MIMDKQERGLIMTEAGPISMPVEKLAEYSEILKSDEKITKEDQERFLAEINKILDEWGFDDSSLKDGK